MHQQQREAGRRTADGVTANDFVDRVLASVADSGHLEQGSLDVYEDQMRRFARFCERGLRVEDIRLVRQEHVLQFIESHRAVGGPPTVATQHLRRGVIRFFFRQGRRLGLASSDPTLDIELPEREFLSTRPLTDQEVELSRLFTADAPNDTRLTSIWALAECTARISEIAEVRTRDVDLERRRVFMSGGTRTLPRWAPMTPWAVDRIGRRLREVGSDADPDVLLVPWRVGAARRPGNAATMAIVGVLKAAGVHEEPGVRPASVVLWAGTRLLREGATIDEVARALGYRSLDRAAKAIRFEWQSDPGERPR